jgi:plastocyanin
MKIKLPCTAAALVALSVVGAPTPGGPAPASDSALAARPATERAANQSSTAAPIRMLVEAKGGSSYKINQYSEEHLRFVPGTVTVASGSTLTFRFGDEQDEIHTLTILPKAELPRTTAQIDDCRPCKIARDHLRDPHDLANALTPQNPFVHWALNRGRPGLDTTGDSLAIESGGAHRSISAVVSAPPGTVLYFVCAIHPWMQGKIIVR